MVKIYKTLYVYMVPQYTCPIDRKELKKSIEVEPFGGGVYEEYFCTRCLATYTAGAVIRSSFGEPKFLKEQADKHLENLKLELHNKKEKIKSFILRINFLEKIVCDAK